MHKFISTSSYGEDAMLFGIMDRLGAINQINLFETGTYMDIGCYHPVYDNNTAFLYQAKWRGTLIDPNPAISSEIDKYRSEDLFLEVAITAEPGTKEFMMFNDNNSCNTLDEKFLDRLKKSTKQEAVKTLNVKCITLDDAMDLHIEKFNTAPSIINIDIEGMDYDIISSYSFKYRPLFIMIEDEILGSFEGSRIKSFLESNNYNLVSSNFLTGIYMDNTDPLFKKIKKIGFYDMIDNLEE